MIRMKDSPHFRSLSRLGCQGDTAAGLLRILDQEGKAESDFASRAGGVERFVTRRAVSASIPEPLSVMRMTMRASCSSMDNPISEAFARMLFAVISVI